MAYKWVMIKPGTVILGGTWDTKGKRHIFTDSEVKRRFCVTQELNYDRIDPVTGKLVEDWSVIHQGRHYFFENIQGAFTEIKIPAMKKEFVTLAVKGSEWEFERDWTFNGWVKNSDKTYTVPASTRVKIIDSKMRLAWYAPQEKCIVAESVPGLEMFEGSSYTGGRNIVGAFIPAREASGYLKLVTAGKVKTYWKMENAQGSAIVDKRFATIGNLKSSLRVRFGLVQEKSDDDYIPDWVQHDGYDKPDTDKGVWAVQYDHATDAVLDRQDMSKFLTITFLKA